MPWQRHVLPTRRTPDSHTIERRHASSTLPSQKDRVFKLVGAMILVSYAFYTPVILFVQRLPMIGMLMIPKTMAYVAIAWLAFANLFPQKGTSQWTQPIQIHKN